MPGAGTDKTKNWVVAPSPVVILVEPQLGENIGAAARAMANFGLSRLRLVKPRQAWPNPQAHKMASGADRVLDQATVHDTLEAAIADCRLVLATTARAHDQAKPVIGADGAAKLCAPRIAAGETVGILFGRERYGLENHEVGLADQIVTLPVNPAFASLNLAQAVAVIAYEWFKHAGSGLPFEQPEKSPAVQKQQLLAFFDLLERELEAIEYFRPPAKRGTMQLNLRNIFTRMQPSQQDVRTLHGVIHALVEGRKGPARGGVLDGRQATQLRALIAEHADGRVPGERTPVRGLSRLLRRNPTDAERTLWEALTRDKRLAGRGFKRQVPVGPHIADLVSFPLRLVVVVDPHEDSAAAATARSVRRDWMIERDYRVVEVTVADIQADIGQVLDRLAEAAGAR